MSRPLPFHLSARALIADTEGRVLLVRRASTSRHFAGQWEFPGGKNDPGEAFDAALLREVAEETGLTVELGRVLGATEHNFPSFRVAYLFLSARSLGGEVRLSAEHDMFAWVSPRDLPTYDLAPPIAAFVTAHAAALRAP